MYRADLFLLLDWITAMHHRTISAVDAVPSFSVTSLSPIRLFAVLMVREEIPRSLTAFSNSALGIRFPSASSSRMSICFTGIHQINQHGKILFLLRCFVPYICDQCRVIALFGFHPEILRGLLSFPFGIYNDCVYKFQNVLFAPDVSERIVMH